MLRRSPTDTSISAKMVTMRVARFIDVRLGMRLLARW
jgi:hypothetical protein